jgi:hypothetical protein
MATVNVYRNPHAGTVATKLKHLAVVMWREINNTLTYTAVHSGLENSHTTVQIRIVGYTEPQVDELNVYEMAKEVDSPNWNGTESQYKPLVSSDM